MTNIGNNIWVNINKIATDLNGKMDKDGNNSTCSVCVETYVNGASWYRVYSDRWCEQGGEVTVAVGGATTSVTFLKPFTNNYTLTYAPFTDSGYNAGEANFRCLTTSTNKICIFYNNSGTTAVYKWQASGYIN